MTAVLHLAAGNRWTGAAAPAFAEVESLRAAGIDAHYAYAGGYKLQEKLGHLAFAHPLIAKAQNPLSFAGTVRALRRFIEERDIELVHAHLTYDHWLARFCGVRLARTFHSRRVLRSDPFTRSLIAKTDVLCVINSEFKLRDAIFTPPPVDHRQFHPDGPNVRARYGIASDAKLLAAIGKLTHDRGFEHVLRTTAATDAHLMIIGHGPHRPALEQLASELGITSRVTWAGYHEDDLAEHYRAANVLLFTERGSDEGHRAILEAMACGVPAASYPIEGVAALTGPEQIAASATPEALANVVETTLQRAELRKDVVKRSRQFGYSRAAERLISAYGLQSGLVQTRS
ncbi:MAG TPA: glycosyltransferase family 4 protein [Thermoanaerobaculia bacterium]|nr:glycosyltransferase family 4 protein [Thermoanaerobaculia bacterium]